MPVDVPKDKGKEFMQIGFFVTPNPDGSDTQIITLEPRRFCEDTTALREYIEKCTDSFIPVADARTEGERIALRIELKKFLQEKPFCFGKSWNGDHECLACPEETKCKEQKEKHHDE